MCPSQGRAPRAECRRVRRGVPRSRAHGRGRAVGTNARRAPSHGTLHGGERAETGRGRGSRDFLPRGPCCIGGLGAGEGPPQKATEKAGTLGAIPTGWSPGHSAGHWGSWDVLRDGGEFGRAGPAGTGDIQGRPGALDELPPDPGCLQVSPAPPGFPRRLWGPPRVSSLHQSICAPQGDCRPGWSSLIPAAQKAQDWHRCHLGWRWAGARSARTWGFCPLLRAPGSCGVTGSPDLGQAGETDAWGWRVGESMPSASTALRVRRGTCL